MSSVKLFGQNVKFMARTLCIVNWKRTAFWAALLPVGVLLLGVVSTHKFPTISVVLLDASIFVGFIVLAILDGALRMMYLKKS